MFLLFPSKRPILTVTFLGEKVDRIQGYQRHKLAFDAHFHEMFLETFQRLLDSNSVVFSHLRDKKPREVLLNSHFLEQL